LRRPYVLVCLVIVVTVALGGYFLLKPRDPALEDVEVLAIIAEGSDYWELDEVNRTLVGEGIVLTTASFTTGKISNLRVQISFDDVDVSQYDAIFIPGGSGPENIINHPDGQKVFDILVQANDQGILIAAICHGPWVLAAADLVDGKNVTCFNDPDMRNDLINSGATVDTRKRVIRDGNIITANGPYAVDAFTEEILNVLIER